jgi:hypothetical protein
MAADPSRQTHGSAGSWHESETYFGKRDTRGACRYDAVCEGGELDARSHTRAVEVNRGLGRHRIDCATGVASESHQVRGGRVLERSELREVAAAAERDSDTVRKHNTWRHTSDDVDAAGQLM